jgi:nitrite reductase/ring-hydroxylating ferredoxin subunit
VKALAALEDVPDGGALAVGEMLLTRAGDTVAAFANRCPHAGFALRRADGTLIVQERRYLVCPVHGASFSLQDGACVGGPCNGEGLAPIAVTVRDGVIYAAV